MLIFKWIRISGQCSWLDLHESPVLPLHSNILSVVCDSSFCLFIFNTINISSLRRKVLIVCDSRNCFSAGWCFCLISVCHLNGWEGWLISWILWSVGFPGSSVLSVSLLEKELENMNLHSTADCTHPEPGFRFLYFFKNWFIQAIKTK